MMCHLVLRACCAGITRALRRHDARVAPALRKLRTRLVRGWYAVGTVVRTCVCVRVVACSACNAPLPSYMRVYVPRSL